jgi:hypothetical protein
MATRSVIMTHGPYGKGVTYQEHYKLMWDWLIKEHPDLLPSSIRSYLTWETVDPEIWVPWGYAVVRADTRGAASPGYLEIFAPRETLSYYHPIEWAGTRPWSNRRSTMSKLAWIVTLAALAAAPAVAETAIHDLRGSWKGESESIILGGGNPHHPPTQSAEPQLRSVAFTLTIDKQDGRRFSGTFSSARGSETVIAVISRTGTIYMVDDDGHDVATMLAPNRMEICYLHLSSASRVASCTELTKQP